MFVCLSVCTIGCIWEFCVFFSFFLIFNEQKSFYLVLLPAPLLAAMKEKILVLLLTLVDRFFVSCMQDFNCPSESSKYLYFFPYFIALWRRMNQLCAYYQPHKYPKYFFCHHIVHIGRYVRKAIYKEW